MDRPQLFVRRDGRPVPAPAEDIEVAEGYEGWRDKGETLGGRRVTIMSASTRYTVGEVVRVVHVLEVTEPGLPIHVMGPKPALEEYVDGRLASEAAVPGVDPLRPAVYDGPIVEGPGVDFNWEITTHRFTEPGRHVVRWQPGALRSNELVLEITES